MFTCLLCHRLFLFQPHKRNYANFPLICGPWQRLSPSPPPQLRMQRMLKAGADWPSLSLSFLVGCTFLRATAYML